ncbi:MAG: M55 family metallopeptidase [Thermoplasmata archaeon]
MKIFISVDAEGLSWTVHGSQTLNDGQDYQIFREIYTDQVNAVISGALEAGAEEILVNDAHGSSKNIIYKNLNSRARLVIGDPKPMSMMQGVEESEKAFLIGYHSKAGTLNGVLNHTYSSNVHRLWLNGEELGEIGLSAAVAGKFNKPVTMLAGDYAAVKEAEKILDDVEFIVLKEGISRYSAITLSYMETMEALKKGAKSAVSRKGKPFKVDEPVTLRLEFLNSGMADYSTLLPDVKRLDGYTVEYEVKDIIDAYKIFRLLVFLSRGDHGGY